MTYPKHVLAIGGIQSIAMLTSGRAEIKSESSKSHPRQYTIFRSEADLLRYNPTRHESFRLLLPSCVALAIRATWSTFVLTKRSVFFSFHFLFVSLQEVLVADLYSSVNLVCQYRLSVSHVISLVSLAGQSCQPGASSPIALFIHRINSSHRSFT